MNKNPFPRADLDRHEIWEILVRHDFESFVARDWSLMEPDFSTGWFCGIDAHRSFDPQKWTIGFPTVQSYRDEWLLQAAEFSKIQLVGIGKLEFLYQACQLETIEISENMALAHKQFNGETKTVDDEIYSFCFQSLYQMTRYAGSWKIAGFVGYLPMDLIYNSGG